MLPRLKERHELDRLTDPRLFREQAYWNGQWQAAESGARFAVCNPATGEIIGYVADLGEADSARAIAAARAAFPGWRSLTPQARAEILRAWYEAICAAREDLAVLMTLEQGKPLDEARGEIDYAASFVSWYAEEARRVTIESVSSHLADADMTVSREPLGVAALVTPWNFPSAMVTRKAAAALAAGCTVLVNPSRETPFSALALAELGERAGLPAGVFNVLTGDPAPIVGRFCDDKRVSALSFTGSTEVGLMLAERAARTMKRTVMELGGHAPFIVFADADFERAVDSAIKAKFATSGQDCLAANRIYVQRPIYDAFVAAFARRAAALKVDNGLEPGVEIGPLMHERALAKVASHVADAVAKGARLVLGGKPHRLGGTFFQPTVLTNLSSDALILSEETFGPVAAILPFDREDEVLAAANGTDYGLVAYLHTQDYARISRLTKALEFGMVAVNRTKLTGPPVPFGGRKLSGIGREGSRLGLEAFTEVKYTCIQAA